MVKRRRRKMVAVVKTAEWNVEDICQACQQEFSSGFKYSGLLDLVAGLIPDVSNKLGFIFNNCATECNKPETLTFLIKAVETSNRASNSADATLRPIFFQCPVFVDEPTFRLSPLFRHRVKQKNYWSTLSFGQWIRRSTFHNCCLLSDYGKKSRFRNACFKQKWGHTSLHTIVTKLLNSPSAFQIFALSLSSSNKWLH
jgi:hypothetical protein